MSANSDTYLFQSLGLMGGEVVTGVSVKTGDFFAILPIAESLVSAEGNIANFTNVTLPAGMTIMGDFNIISSSGTLIIYYK